MITMPRYNVANAMAMAMTMVMLLPTSLFAFVVNPSSTTAAATTARLSTAISATSTKKNQKNTFFSSPQLQQQQPSNGTYAFTSLTKLFASSSSSPSGGGGGGDASTQAATASTAASSQSSMWDNAVSTLWKSPDLTGDVATRQQQQQQQADDSVSSSWTGVMDELTRPVQSALDSTLDGWVLSYADLRPDNATTLLGASFLATNLAYLLVGVTLTVQTPGDAMLGLLTDVTAIASFMYHYTQLEAAGQMSVQTVRLALLTDYACAAITMGTASVYLLSDTWTAGGTLPVDALAAATVSLAFLGLSWVYEKGRPYMFFHSLWHFLSAYAGYLIGTEHALATAGGVAATTGAVLNMDAIVSTATGIMAGAAAAAAMAGEWLPSAL